MKRVPLYYYVASNNPKGGQGVLQHFGLTPAVSPQALARGLRYVTVKFGEEGIREIAKAHPDTSLILDVNRIEEESIPEKKSNCNGNCNCKNQTTEIKSNACGCSSINGEMEIPLKQTTPEKEVTSKALTKEDVANEVKKVVDEQPKFQRDVLPYLVGIGIAALLIKEVFKK